MATEGLAECNDEPQGEAISSEEKEIAHMAEIEDDEPMVEDCGFDVDMSLFSFVLVNISVDSAQNLINKKENLKKMSSVRLNGANLKKIQWNQSIGGNSVPKKSLYR